MSEALTFAKYQEESATTAVYPKERGLEYTVLGLVGEAGELANKVKKIIRGDVGNVAGVRMELSSELGDVLWYLSAIATELNVPLDDIARENLRKLFDRKERGVLKGSGDTR